MYIVQQDAFPVDKSRRRCILPQTYARMHANETNVVMETESTWTPDNL